jgi:hypothetical protein
VAGRLGIHRFRVAARREHAQRPEVTPTPGGRGRRRRPLARARKRRPRPSTVPTPFHQSQVGSGAAGLADRRLPAGPPRSRSPTGSELGGLTASPTRPGKLFPAYTGRAGAHALQPAARHLNPPASGAGTARHANLCRLRRVVGRAAGVGREWLSSAGCGGESRSTLARSRRAPGSIEERARALLARCAGVLEELGGRGGSIRIGRQLTRNLLRPPCWRWSPSFIRLRVRLTLLFEQVPWASDVGMG